MKETTESRLDDEFFIDKVTRKLLTGDADDILAFIESEKSLATERAKEEVRSVLLNKFKPRPAEKHYGATTDNKRKAKNTLIKEIATDLGINLNLDSILSPDNHKTT